MPLFSPPMLFIGNDTTIYLLSMIYQNPSFGSIHDEGVIFYRSSQGKKEKYNFSPEKAIQVQMNLGSDILSTVKE